MNYTFAEAASKLNKSQNQIDQLIINDRIREYVIEVLNYEAKYQSTNRIKRLMNKLNEYVNKYIDEDPTKIIQQFGTFKLSLSNDQVETLRNAADNSFEALLIMCNIDINKIRLLIPVKEISRYKKRLNRLAKKKNIEKEMKLKESNRPFDEIKPEISAFVNSLRNQKTCDKIIAVKLAQLYPKVKAIELYGLMYPARLEAWSKSEAKVGRPKERFRYLKTKGLKMLAEQKMTTSEITDQTS